MIDTAALREKVLDLAIRGKLVPQDPNDEPASVLLERIHEQKLQMVREGKLKAKDVKDDTIIFKGDDNCYYEKYSDGSVKNIQDEIPFDLPDGWSWSRATSILTLISGQDLTPDKYNSNNIGIPYITGASNFENGHITINRWTEFPQAISIMGDILLTCKGTIGEMAINIIGDTHIARQIMALRGSEYINNGYLELVMQSEISSIIKKADGLIPGISRPVILELLLPIAPCSEQLKIVESTKILLQNVNDINLWSNEIETIKSLIKSKVLELAIQGKLVPQDENNELASVLLERIRAERKAKLGKKYVESYIFKGDDNCYYEKVGSTVKNITDQIPFSIPQNWSFVRLKELAKVVSGVSYDKRDICNDGIRIIRGGNISNLSIVLLPDDVFLPQKYYDNEKEVKTEDIVIVASTGSKIAIGRPAFADKSFPQTQIGAFLRIVRPYVPNVYQYLKCLFASNYYREHISDLVHGNTINNIKTEYLDEFIIPFPPIREQKEIANKVKILMDILKGGD